MHIFKANIKKINNSNDKTYYSFDKNIEKL